jgi:hypothetical protein
VSDVAHPYGGPSRLRAAWAALRGRAAAEPELYDSSVSFAELVWAHNQRQEELANGVLNGDAELEYRRRLAQFKREHGEIVESYWCRYEASGAALTRQRLPWRWTTPMSRDYLLRLHTATDWRTESAPEIAAYLHRWETAAIKAGEVLRETSERIALHRIFSICTRLLALVDKRRSGKGAPDSMADLMGEQRRELAEIDAYYRRAGRNSARIVYFRGMVWGSAALAVAVGVAVLVLWSFDVLHPGQARTHPLFASIGMGAIGAILSVMTRMASEKEGFNLDFEVGRKSVRFLGALRPWIGAIFAFALYLAMQAHLVEIAPKVARSLYFWATIAFIAGFSERKAKVLIDGILGGGGHDDDPPPPPHHPPAARDLEAEPRGI